MSIAKGQEWGRPGRLPVDAPVASGDADAAGLTDGPHRIIGLDGGDLARTLGMRAPYRRGGDKQIVPVDVVEVELDDGTTHRFVAHAVLGRPFVGREATAIMNAAFIGEHNLAPRAHPGDGRVDVVRLDLPVGDRLEARRRSATGSHLPHPGVSIRSASDGRVELSGRRPVTIDGRRCGRSSSLDFRVLPGAIEIAVG